VAVRALETDAEGRLWVGAVGGIAVLDGDLEVALTVDEGDGLPSDDVLSLLLDSQGYMWVGTSRGVAMLDIGGSVHATFSTRDGLAHDTVNALAEHPPGTMWVGTAGGLSRLDKDRWGVIGQSDKVFEELPDVVLSPAGVEVLPREPNDGDEVLVNVTVSNPTTKRAIASVELSTDESGQPGGFISGAIAYTEPGGEYVVQLSWVAEGGDQTLWVVADPLGLVPELNERNNAVSVNLHVNRAPSLMSLNATLEGVQGNAWNQEATFALTVTYRDLDGDPPVEMTAHIEGADPNRTSLFPVAGSGGIHDGKAYRGTVLVGKGNWTVVVHASDGAVWATEEILIGLNLEVGLVGIADGEGITGTQGFTIAVGETWEGTSIVAVEVRLVEPGWSGEPGEQWFDALRVNASLEGLEVSLDLGDVEPGKWDLFVVVTDDRGVMAAAMVRDVEIKEEGTVLTPWFFIAGVLISILIAIYVVKVLWRSGGT
jgi:hypothetical protein